MQLHKLTALVAATLMCSSTLSPGAIGAASDSSINSSVTSAVKSVKSGDVVATVTAKENDVFKRDFIDWNRDQWGESTPANVNDPLREGMQIGTGPKSWAEVTWPSVKTRAWANTVFAVAPNKRLVYLTGGEMLFRLDKHRKDKDPYFIWTKVLQARIRGTTVLVQSKGNRSRISVMEGKIDVYNRLDHSTVTITPGTVYDVTGYNLQKASPMPSVKGGPTASAPSSAPSGGNGQNEGTNQLKGINDVSYDKDSPFPVFQNANSSSKLYAVNSQALLNHPLVNVSEPIDSLPLMRNELANVPGYSQILPFKTADQVKLKNVVFANAEVKAVPNNVSYFIGQSVGNGIRLAAPVAIQDIPPLGAIITPEKTTVPQATVAVQPKMPPPIVPMIPGLLSGTPAEAAESLNEEAPMPVQEYANARVSDPKEAQVAAPSSENSLPPLTRTIQPAGRFSAGVVTPVAPVFNNVGPLGGLPGGGVGGLGGAGGGPLGGLGGGGPLGGLGGGGGPLGGLGGGNGPLGGGGGGLINNLLGH